MNYIANTPDHTRDIEVQNALDDTFDDTLLEIMERDIESYS